MPRPARNYITDHSGNPVFCGSPFNAAECSGWMRMKVTRCLRPDLSGRVRGTAADNRAAREAEGQVEGGLSFASFSGMRLDTK